MLKAVRRRPSLNIDKKGGHSGQALIEFIVTVVVIKALLASLFLLATLGITQIQIDLRASELALCAAAREKNCKDKIAQKIKHSLPWVEAKKIKYAVFMQKRSHALVSTAEIEVALFKKKGSELWRLLKIKSIRVYREQTMRRAFLSSAHLFLYHFS